MFRRSNRRASNAAFALGAGVLANALMTDYPLGVFRVYSFKVHGILDYGVALASGLMPELTGIGDSPEAKYFHYQGSGETAIAAITDYSDDTGAKHKRTERIPERLAKTAERLAKTARA
jgi:hypothetical protein